MRKLTAMALLALCTIGAQNAEAQNAENRSLIYLGAGIEKEFTKQLSASLDVESRFCSAKNTQDILVTPSIEYAPIKYLAFGVEYRAGYEHQKDKESTWSGRFGAMAKASISPSILKFEVREKYCNYSEDYEDEGNLQYLRTKFEASAKIKAIKLTPYISYEFFYNISRSLVDKDRYTVGLKKKLNKRNTIGVEYMLEEKFNRGKNKIDINKHIFALNYKYSIPAPKKKDKEKLKSDKTDTQQ